MIASILRSFKDFLTFKILMLSLIPFILSGALLAVLFYLLHTQIAGYFPLIASYIPFVSAAWVQGISESFLGTFIFYEFWVMFALIFVGLISDRVVDTINDKYYHLEKKGFGSTAGSLFTALKSNTLFLLLFIITSPLLLIPGINILLHILLWMVMLKAPMYYDACAFYASKKEFKTIKRKHKGELFLITLFSASLLLIPFVGVFLYLYQLILYTHFSLGELKKI